MSFTKRHIFKFLLFAAFFAPLGAEVFRTQKTVMLAADENASERKKVGINACASIKLPEDLTFVQGIEILVKIPKVLANFQNTILYSLYDSVAPFPSEGETDYSGKAIYSGLYPGHLSWSIVVPLVKGNTITQSPYADKTLIPDSSRGFVFLRNQLAMKGIPQEVMDAEFEVSAKTVFTDFGAIRIRVNRDSGEFSVMVDDAAAKPNDAGLIFLKPGKHSVSVISEKFRNEVRTVVVEQAKTTEIELVLKSVEPTFSFNAPQGTQIFVDGNEIANSGEVRLEVGNHVFKFVLGGYEVVRNVEIQNGKHYDISVNFEANIKESE